VDLLRAIFLGLLQGATEFLPISSSGHLVLVPWWLGWDESPLTFDVVVHLGTLVAVLVFFWRDWLTLLRASIHALRNAATQNVIQEDPDARLVLWLIVGTIPAAIAGTLLDNVFEAAFARPSLAAFFLLITVTLLVFSERHYTAESTLDTMTARDALTIGVAQAFAIFPGISRSGSTMAAGILRGLPRIPAARFSFLLATPVIFGAGMKQVVFDVLTKETTVSADMIVPLIAGFLAAAVMGFGCIWFFLRLLQRRRLYGFAAYCAAFGVLSLGRSLLVALF
jgi:undecaprenyl-diphosphatase